MIVSPPEEGMSVLAFLENLREAVNRVGSITGDGKRIDISDEPWGKQISFRESDNKALVLMAVVGVKEDYLECKKAKVMVGDSGGESADSITKVLVSKATTYVAKPWHLRKTPWEGQDNEDGEKITYSTTEMDERVVYKTEFYGKKTERIYPAYELNRIDNIVEGEAMDSLPSERTQWPVMIMASEPDGGTGVEKREGERQVLTWQDINMDGRHWDVPNIVPGFPAGDPLLFDIRLHGTSYKGTDTAKLNNGWDDDAGDNYDLSSGSDEANSDYEGDEDPDENKWKVDEQPENKAGLKIPFVTRVAYKHDSDEELYGYARMLTFDVTGRLHSVGRETRFVIDTPVTC